jgi:hypothetical protein
MNGRTYFAAALSAAALIVSATAQTPQGAIPRARDGHPNLSGIWQTLSSANFDLQDHGASKGIPAEQGVVEGGVIPYQEWAVAKKKQNYAHREAEDPEEKGFLLGIPRLTYSGHPFQIFQSSGPEPITILYEYSHANRIVYLDGTPHPKGPIEWWLGDARAHWEKDTLVVDNVHFNDKTWLDRAGDFHSEELHVVERYTLADADHIEYQATLTDPKVFTKPWNINLILYRRKEKNVQLLDYEAYAFDLEQYYPLPTEAGGK